MKRNEEEVNDMLKARYEYAKKFGRNAPSIGFEVKLTPKEYAEILRESIKIGKPIKRGTAEKGMIY